ncbi:MAG: hypothetical protein J6V93_02495 [Clostridia bacterium]|nr:hypothetical protein [Clostridia bacterium]
MSGNRILFRNIKLPYDQPADEAIDIAVRKAAKLGIKAGSFDARIAKRSVDARKSAKNPEGKPHFIYSVSVPCEKYPDAKLLERADAAKVSGGELTVEYGRESLLERPVIVGFGPCGMFAALELAKNGYRPIVLERGADVSDRRAAVDRFYATGVLEESNIQFGAGGAGTFSDGKLVTRINDPKCAYVLDTLYELGAPEEILYNAKPHVGTDKLLDVVQNAADKICELGGEILYNTRLDDIRIENGRVKSVKLSTGRELECSVIILAIGHSARDTYNMLFERGTSMAAKPFSVGVRVEHFQKSVDESLYGSFAGDARLPKGEYALSRRENGRAVYTFCMCPGGEVVAAASEEGGVVTNGMSRFARDGVNANAALAVSVEPEDYGNTPMKAIELQRMLERAAYKVGGGGYKAPVETVGDFLDKKSHGLSAPCDIIPTYMDSKYTVAPLDTVLPDYVCDMLRLGITDFSRKMRCFGEKSAVLTGVETRTSAPLRILRNEEYTALGIQNMYPAGEGAGYAGGITSAAVDGINTALAVMKKYSPLD